MPPIEPKPSVRRVTAPSAERADKNAVGRALYEAYLRGALEQYRTAVDPRLTRHPELLRDVRTVGPHKPLGYLPLSTIGSAELLGQLINEAKGRGQVVYVYGPGDCEIGSGACFIFDAAALQRLLSNNALALRRAEVPVQVQAFVDHVARTNVEDSAARRVLDVAFNDPTSR